MFIVAYQRSRRETPRRAPDEETMRPLDKEITRVIGPKEVTLTFLCRAPGPWLYGRLFLAHRYSVIAFSGTTGRGYVPRLSPVYEYRPPARGENENLIFLKSTETSGRSYGTQEPRKCVRIIAILLTQDYFSPTRPELFAFPSASPRNSATPFGPRFTAEYRLTVKEELISPDRRRRCR